MHVQAPVCTRECVYVCVCVRYGAAVDEADIIYAKLWPDLAKVSLIFVGLFHNAHYLCIFYGTSCICMCVCVRACVSVACVLLLISMCVYLLRACVRVYLLPV